MAIFGWEQGLESLKTFSFWDSVSCIPEWPWTCWIAKDVLQFWIHLPLPPPKCWDCRHSLPHPVSVMLEIELGVVCILVKHSINWATSFFYFYFVDRVLLCSLLGWKLQCRPGCPRLWQKCYFLLSTFFLREGGVGKREGGSGRKEKQLGNVKVGQEYVSTCKVSGRTVSRKNMWELNHKEICVSA